MDLLAITAGIVGAVNPQVPAVVQISTGSTPGTAGKRVPTYESPVTILAQVQALTYDDLRQVEGLNLNGTRRAIYFEGELNGVVRSKLKGGDLVTLSDGPNAGTWLVAHVLEQWEDWVKVAVTLQQDP